MKPAIVRAFTRSNELSEKTSNGAWTSITMKVAFSRYLTLACILAYAIMARLISTPVTLSWG